MFLCSYAMFNTGWRTNSEIVHYMADSPEGPFEFVKVVASSEKIDGNWNKAGFQNPHFQKVD